MKPKKSQTIAKSYSHRQGGESNTSSSSVAHFKREKHRSSEPNIEMKLHHKGYTCSGCNKLIKREKYLLSACDKFWHESCLKCDQCHAKLGELGSTLFVKSDMILCRQDFLDLFGPSCVCAVCEKLIRASEMVMRAKHNVYHLECFACQLCNQRFCVGDQFYLLENKVICQYDYEDIQRSMTAPIEVNYSSPEVNHQIIREPPPSESSNLFRDEEEADVEADVESRHRCSSDQHDEMLTFQELTASKDNMHRNIQANEKVETGDELQEEPNQMKEPDEKDFPAITDVLVVSTAANGLASDADE